MIACGHNSRMWCGLVGNANERRPFPDVNKVQVSCVNLWSEDQRLERTDFAVVDDSPSIGAGPGISLFRKLSSQTRFCPGEPLCITRQNSSATLGPVVISYRFVCMSFCLPLTQEIAKLTRACTQTSLIWLRTYEFPQNFSQWDINALSYGACNAIVGKNRYEATPT